jgi:DNA primase
MSLLQLLNELNLSSKRVASTNGGEYHGPCPSCGGKDRFIIWEQQGRYLCRQCSTRGDAIQFCRDFMGLDYRSACMKIGVEAKTSFSQKTQKYPQFQPPCASEPPLIWQKNAEEFTSFANHQLMQNPQALNLLYQRGFSLETISLFSLGWNPVDQFVELPTWGLPLAWNEIGRERKVWLPQGIVIPSLLDKNIIKLKIRRSQWHKDDHFPKYIEVSGSMKCPSLYDTLNKQAFVILESELDAMLIQQHAADLCCCMAIGGASKKPDASSHELLKHTSLILFALDFDAAGKAAYRFWRSTYPNLRAWPISKGKSPGDALKLGVDLRQWILERLKQIKIIK